MEGRTCLNRNGKETKCIDFSLHWRIAAAVGVTPRVPTSTYPQEQGPRRHLHQLPGQGPGLPPGIRLQELQSWHWVLRCQQGGL